VLDEWDRWAAPCIYKPLRYSEKVLARLLRLGLLVLLAAAFIFVGDYLAVRLPGSRNPFGTLTVQPYYAIRLKNKKTEFDFNAPPETRVCVHSLFPHLGYPPCWYAAKQTQPRIDE